MKQRLKLAIFFLALIPIGYWLRFRAPFAPAVRDAGGGAVYVLLWVVFAAAVFPFASPLRLAVAVTSITCALEFLQLWHPAWLEALRATFPGRVVLGTTFGWSDFPPYFVGGLLGWLVVASISRRTARASQMTKSDPTFRI